VSKRQCLHEDPALRARFEQFESVDSTKGCGPLDATNASKHSIDQSKDRILQINQSKNASKHL